VTYFGTSSQIRGLDAAGRIVVANGFDLYLAIPPYGALDRIGSSAGRVQVRDGDFVFLVGGTVFTLP